MAVSEASVKELADFLKSRKKQGKHVELFLGHRTGVLYSPHLCKSLDDYTKKIAEDFLKNFIPDSKIHQEISTLLNRIRLFDDMPASERSKECYNFLSKHFSEIGIDSILFNVLKHSGSREDDKLMAELIKAIFFNTILMTNFDTLLEDACGDSIGMKETDDYKLFIYGSAASKTVEERGKYGRVIKAFGDFDSLNHKTIRDEFNLEKDQLVKRFLTSEMSKDVVVLGFDPIWDKPIEKIFSNIGGMLWYVNEDLPPPNSELASALNQRYSQFVGGQSWKYDAFLQTLSDLLGEKTDSESTIEPSSLPASSHDTVRKKAFISYSHKDRVHLERLRVHLRGFLNAKYGNNTLQIQQEMENFKVLRDDFWDIIWDDTKIRLGANWLEDIKEALSQTKIAICLVSADFFESDFIHVKELPVLYEAAEAGQVKIVSIIISDSPFEDSNLSKYQTINPPNEPLISMLRHEQEAIWRKLAKHIFTSLNA